MNESHAATGHSTGAIRPPSGSRPCCKRGFGSLPRVCGALWEGGNAAMNAESAERSPALCPHGGPQVSSCLSRRVS